MPKMSMNQQWNNAIKEDILKERLAYVSFENKTLKDEIEHLKLKIEAMEIADKMVMNHLRMLEKDREALLESLKQVSRKMVHREDLYDEAHKQTSTLKKIHREGMCEECCEKPSNHLKCDNTESQGVMSVCDTCLHKPTGK